MTPKVQYSYSDGSANQVRPAGMAYPNGREIAYGYGAAGGMDDGLSRLASISDGGAPRANFQYLSLSTPVRVEYPEPGLSQDLWGGSPGQYSGLDPFLRVVDLRWRGPASSSSSSSSSSSLGGAGDDLVRIRHGYDCDSNRLWRENPVAAAVGHPQDQLYAYDNLNRLIQMQRGLLNVPHTGLTQKDFDQAWGLDKAGNWSRFDQRDITVGGVCFDQTRRTNKGNEIVGISEVPGQPAWVSPSYDAAGNMRSFPKPADPTGSFGAVYDAWNRLVKVTDGQATLAEYAYDGRSFRTKKTAGGTERDYYYSSGWQVLEERVGSNVERQHVWGLGINSLVLCDRDSDGDGVIDERLYALQDAHWDMCATADAAGNVLERYEYEAYGQPRILDPGFGPRADSWFDWEVLFQGSARDAETGLYQVRNRYYHPVLGSWITRDPLFDHWGGRMLASRGLAETGDIGGKMRIVSLGCDSCLGRLGWNDDGAASGQNGAQAIQMLEAPNCYGYVRNSPTIAADYQGLQKQVPSVPVFSETLRAKCEGRKRFSCTDGKKTQNWDCSARITYSQVVDCPKRIQVTGTYQSIQFIGAAFSTSPKFEAGCSGEDCGATVSCEGPGSAKCVYFLVISRLPDGRYFGRYEVTDPVRSGPLNETVDEFGCVPLP